MLKETLPEKIVATASAFERGWPHSELLAQVLELQSEAFVSLGDPRNAILTGEKALAAAPDNLAVLANLSYNIANSTAEVQQLDRAAKYAHHVLDLSRTIRIPRKISPQEWEETKSHLTALAHASLGLVAYKREDTHTAIREFESAVESEQPPSPAHLLRLGLLYRTIGNRAQAVEMFRRAAGSGDAAIRVRAEAELNSTTKPK